MTLIRLAIAGARCRGGGTSSYRMPSTRYRILYSSSNGSKWMSDALSLIASSSTMFRSFRTGAASAISSIASRSIVLSLRPIIFERPLSASICLTTSWMLSWWPA